MAGNLVPLPPLTAAWVDSNGSPTQVWRNYLLSVDKLLQTLAGANIISATNDAAAAAAGVPIGGLYLASGKFKVRLV